MSNILVTGGCGYMGSVLVPKLLNQGHKVDVYDTQWFGNELKENKNLSIHKVDIRDIDKITMNNIDVVIHLANIANDPSVDLNPVMSWEVNVLASQQLADKAYRESVNQFIFASSGSVYGVKTEPKVTEDLSLVPISTYNKTKMVAERIFLSYKDYFKVQCIRPATVCGVSPRMRLDVAVNLLTYQALTKKEITVLGGEQVRPNIHIEDITDLYIHLINYNSKFESGCYNAGFENISILEIARKIQSKINCEVKILPSNDPRSYRQDSTKLLRKGFSPKKTVEDAIDEIILSFKNNKLSTLDSCFTVKWMKEKNFK